MSRKIAKKNQLAEAFKTTTRTIYRWEQEYAYGHGEVDYSDFLSLFKFIFWIHEKKRIQES